MLTTVSVVLAICAFVAWLLGSAAGAGLALRLGLGFVGEAQVEQVRGSIATGLWIGRLRLETPTMGLAVDDARLVVDWRALTRRELRLVEVGAGRVALALPEAPAEEEPAPPSPPLDWENLWPSLPGQLRLEQLSLGEFTMAAPGAEPTWRVANVLASGQAGSEGAGIKLDRLSFEMEGVSVQAVGQAAVAAEPGVMPVLETDLHVLAQQGEYDADVTLTAKGTPESLAVQVAGTGTGLEVEADAAISLIDTVLPVRSLNATVRGVDLAVWAPTLPPGRFNVNLNLDLQPITATTLPSWAANATWAEPVAAMGADLNLTFLEGSSWRDHPLSGGIKLTSQGLHLTNAEADLRLGANHVTLAGLWGNPGDTLKLNVDLPRPGQLWEGLDGGADLAITLTGSPEAHGLEARGRVNLPAALRAPASARAAAASAETAPDWPVVLRQDPITLDLALNGGWTAPGSATPSGWRGTVQRLAVANPSVSLQLGQPMTISVLAPAAIPDWQWQVGATTLTLNLPGKRQLVLQHGGSSGVGQQWASQGRIDDLIPAWLVAQFPATNPVLRLDVDWDLRQTQALAGRVRLVRKAGDIGLPGTSTTLGLNTLALTLDAQPGTGAESALDFSLEVAGERLGEISAQGNTTVRVVDGVPTWTPETAVEGQLRFNMADIAWASMFTGDDIELGGRVQADVSGRWEDGNWSATGPIEARGLKVILIDQGVRLMDGTLDARLDNDRVVVEELRFPAMLRVQPSDRRMQAWIAANPTGEVKVSGEWSITDASGSAAVVLRTFPLVQQADRFIAGSGSIGIEASPQALSIIGRVLIDAGWVSLVGIDTLPSLSSDVVVIRTGDEAEKGPPLPMRLRLELDLGSNFYLSGMGLDTGLTGSLEVRNGNTGMRARGVVRTRDGRFEAYGQSLVIRDGEITFQDRLDDPLLNIVAVRPGLQIEAGVQVLGTAKQPAISLVSYPEVSEVEKLSWLLLGRGPDDSGADAGMLLSAAASLLSTEGEPLYRQFGLDELGLRSGTAGSVRGLLPVHTVAGDINQDEGAVATQFLVAGKRLSDALYVTFEQALAGRETLVRGSYRISQQLSAAAQVGTVNGLRLVWSLVFQD